MTPYTYGPYGEPQSWAGSRFRYTGQIALPEAQLYHYKARVYDPTTGRFLQTDPIGYGDGMNVYAYTRGDPVNASDPSGNCQYSGTGGSYIDSSGTLTVWCPRWNYFDAGGGSSGQWTGNGYLPLAEFIPSPNGGLEAILADAICEAGTGSDCIDFGSKISERVPHTFGSNPRNSGSRINTDKVGDAGTALADADYLVILNGGGGGISNYTVQQVMSGSVPGWRTIGNLTSGHVVNQNIMTDIVFRTDGFGVVRVEIPSGLLISPGFRNDSNATEVVHYRPPGT